MLVVADKTAEDGRVGAPAVLGDEDNDRVLILLRGPCYLHLGCLLLATLVQAWPTKGGETVVVVGDKSVCAAKSTPSAPRSPPLPPTTMSYALLTLPNVSVRSAALAEVGTLALECTSDSRHDSDVPGDPTASLSLILRLNAHSFLVERGRPVSLVIAPSGERAYTFEAEIGEKSPSLAEKRPPSTVRVVIPPPSSNGGPVAEDIETFDHLLSQYGDLAWSYGDPTPLTGPPPPPQRVLTPSGPPPPLPVRSPSPSGPHKNIGNNVGQARPIDDPSLRGRLVLMDEANGEVVGELPQSLNITEDPAMGAGMGGGRSTAPVVLEMDPEMYDACTGVRALTPGDDLLETRDVFARAVPPEEQDWYMKSATFIRCV